MMLNLRAGYNGAFSLLNDTPNGPPASEDGHWMYMEHDKE